MRRTNEEINAIYQTYLTLDKSRSANSRAKELGITSPMIAKWDTGTIPRANAAIDTVYYKSRIVEEHVVANGIPIKDEIYLLLVQGFNVETIAFKLDRSVESVANMKAYFLKENIINPNQLNADLTIHEIAMILGFTERETTSLYKSGIKKIMESIGDIHDLLDDSNEFRNTDGRCSVKCYSSMMH